jgi:hypothetical protein
MRINWISSSPSQASDVQLTYEKLIIPHLSKNIILQTWTEENLELAKIPWQQMNQADLNIYLIDQKNPENAWVRFLSQTAPGVMILLTSQLSKIPEGGGFQEFRSLLFQSHGLKAVEDLERRDTGFLSQYPLPLYGLKKGVGLITDCKEIQVNLSHQVSYPIVHRPFPYKLEIPSAHNLNLSSIERIGIELPHHLAPFRDSLIQQFPQYQWITIEPGAEKLPENTDLFVTLVSTGWGISRLPWIAFSHGVPCFVPTKEFTLIPSYGAEFLSEGDEEQSLIRWMTQLDSHRELLSKNVLNASDFIQENHDPRTLARKLENDLTQFLSLRASSVIREMAVKTADVFTPLLPDHWGEIPWNRLNY